MSIKLILCDIEGTTSSISFVHDVMFPLAFEKMDSWIESNYASVSGESKQFTAALAERLQRPAGSLSAADIADELKRMIKADVKDTFLKLVQGRIWKESFESGSLKSHFYDDVVPAFEKWINSGLKIAIYSSGSVEAQKLFFRYSEKGDLSSFLSGYYDTTSGPKKEKKSYCNIASALQLKPEEILFLSDISEELDAASSCGMHTLLSVRGELASTSRHKSIHTFADVTV